LFRPASVQALLRFGHAVLKTALNSKALITESAMARMSLLATSVNEKMAEVRSAITLPPELEKVCDQLPAHLSHASDVNCDLRGLRLNVMRLVRGELSIPRPLGWPSRRLCCLLAGPLLTETPMGRDAPPQVTGLSKPAMLQQMGQAKSLAPFLRDLNAAAQLSLTIDVIEPLLRSATEPTALLADPIKLERIFVGALDAKPTDWYEQLTTRPSHVTTRPSHVTTRPSHVTTRPSHFTTRPSHFTTRPSQLTHAAPCAERTRRRPCRPRRGSIPPRAACSLRETARRVRRRRCERACL
jgi:hypothetical protein